MILISTCMRRGFPGISLAGNKKAHIVTSFGEQDFAYICDERRS